MTFLAVSYALFGPGFPFWSFLATYELTNQIGTGKTVCQKCIPEEAWS